MGISSAWVVCGTRRFIAKRLKPLTCNLSSRKRRKSEATQNAKALRVDGWFPATFRVRCFAMRLVMFGSGAYSSTIGVWDSL
jgi:hypothetical protein